MTGTATSASLIPWPDELPETILPSIAAVQGHQDADQGLADKVMAGAPEGAFLIDEGLRAISIQELLKMELPKRPKLLDPWLPEKGLAMIYATRGIGKTFLGLAIAYAVASGGRLFDRWQAPTPRKVLYIDGEMPLAVLKDRLRAIVLGADAEAAEENFMLIPADLHRDGLPNLATLKGQQAIERLLEGADLVVLDNLSTLAASPKDNDADSWSPMQSWLLSLRRRGVAVLLIHHAAKAGQQRGTSRREDILDTSILLKRPDDYDVREGARFEIHFEKARGILGDDVTPFEAKMEIRADEGLRWTTKETADVKQSRVMALVDEGLSVRDIAEETGMSKSTVDRIKKAALAAKAGGP